MQLFIKKDFGSDMTKLIICDKEMNDTMKIVKYLEKSGLLIKGVSKTTQAKSTERTKRSIS